MTNVTYSTDGKRPAGAIPVLPSPSRERLEHLDGLADAAEAQGDSRSLSYLQLVEARNDAAGNLAAYEARCREENNEPHADSLAGMQDRLDRAERALRLHTEAAPYLDANAIGRLRRDVLVEARRHGANSKPWRGSIRKGATLSGLRDVLADLKTERASVEAAPPPMEDELNRLFGEIDKAAARGMPRAAIQVDDVYDGRGSRTKLRAASKINWPTVTVNQERVFKEEPIVVLDAAAMISWLFSDQIKAALRSELEQAYRQFDGAVMTLAQKRIELKRIAGEILRVEQEIAALAWPELLGGDHQAVRWLYDLQPRAVLGLEV
jgi:hypothetical protein